MGRQQSNPKKMFGPRMRLQDHTFIFWVILMRVFRVLIKNPVKESFYEKKKKIINILTTFFISHKSDVKTFFNYSKLLIETSLRCVQ